MALTITRQEAGRFDHRFAIGPACWPDHDLLWIHEGSVRLKVGQRSAFNLCGPSGILILAGTHFSGTAIEGVAYASVCHFKSTGEVPDVADRILRHHDRDAFHLQGLIQVSMALARAQVSDERRARLLAVVVEFFTNNDQPSEHRGRVAETWAQATDKLDMMRTISDVAAIAGLSESAFRALHRASETKSAGAYLRDLRLTEAENLMATTGNTIAEISKKVGYAHPETFVAAYRRSRGGTPSEYRRRCHRLA